MWTLVIVGAIAVVVLAVLVRIGNRQRRADRPGAPGGGKVAPKATGTTDTYHREL